MSAFISSCVAASIVPQTFVPFEASKMFEYIGRGAFVRNDDGTAKRIGVIAGAWLHATDGYMVCIYSDGKLSHWEAANVVVRGGNVSSSNN